MKRLSLVLVFVLLLGISLNVMAAEGRLNHSETIVVQANVAPYARIEWGDEYPAEFSGAANERKTGKYYFALETNCRVGFTLYTTALTQTVNGVVYEVDRNGIHWGIKKLPGKGNYGPNQGTGAHNWYRGRQLQDIGKTEYYLDFQATTGPNISDQYAGTYTANVTITITSLDS